VAARHQEFEGAAAVPLRVALKADVPAALVVALVALPLCLGIALASGAPLMAGLIAGVVGGLVVAPISGSALMVSGPAAGLTAVVLQATGTLGSFQAVTVAVALGGVLQILMGAVKAGVLARFIPSSVVEGMLAAIGLLLILKQIPHLLGSDSDPEGEMSFEQPDGENTFTKLLNMVQFMEPGALVAALTAGTLLLLWDHTALKRQRVVPGALAAVASGLAVNAVLGAWKPEWALGATHLVQIPLLADLAQSVAWPDLTVLTRGNVWKAGVTFTVVASLETLLSLEATDKMDPLRRRTPPDRELVAQGVGNLTSGLLGGLPITGVIVRSAANVNAGGLTHISAILHGFFLLLAVLAFPGLLNRIPLASLAAVLVLIGFKLTAPALWRAAWTRGREHFIPFAVTVVAILLTDLLVGIFVGLAVGVYFILREHAAAPGLIPLGPAGSVVQRFSLGQQATFLSRPSVERSLQALPHGSRVEIDARETRRIDPDVLALLRSFEDTARERHIDYRLIGVPSRPRH